MQRMRQGLSAIGPTPAERRVDEGGPAPDLTRGLSGSLQAIAEILGPQADIAAMVDEAKRAESSFAKGNYMDAAGSMGLAAIAPLMIATPGSVKSVREVSESISENIPVMPVNQAKLEQKGFEFKPGGEYVNPKNNEILTGKNVGFANIKIVPEMGIKGGRPMASFNVNNLDVPEVGTIGKGNTDIKVNLVKPTSTGKNSRGWLWADLKDENFKDVNTLVSVEVPSKKKHYYTMETDFSKGANLKTYPKNRDEPRLRPTVKGTLDFEDQIGTIQMGKDKKGKPVMHPVYRRIVAKYTGGQIKKSSSVIERNPYGYPPRAI